MGEESAATDAYEPAPDQPEYTELLVNHFFSGKEGIDNMMLSDQRNMALAYLQSSVEFCNAMDQIVTDCNDYETMKGSILLLLENRKSFDESIRLQYPELGSSDKERFNF